MKIAEAADRSGLPAKTIRYYGEIGLVAPQRAGNGYRDYDTEAVHRLAFLRRARALGFSIEECRRLLSLYADDERASHEVKTLVLEHIDGIEERIGQLEGMKRELERLATACRGDDRPRCPILDDLAGRGVTKS